MLSIVTYFLIKQHQCSQLILPHPTPVVTAPVAELTKPCQYLRQYASENPPVVSVMHQVMNWSGLAVG